ncbi:MAG: M48 family metallopeptidase [Bacteroidales bacterium]|nr:M48 family metallopeptidase [Bacteroidales bacterium]
MFLLAVACSTVPLTGRRQLLLMPESEVVSLSLTSYSSFLEENKLSSNTTQADAIKRVGARLSKAVEEYLRLNGLEKEIANFQWEFNLVESDEVNAWCMPGGKVVFYTGILPITQDDTGIAVVMGHEIAHAVAKHGNERMSQSMMAELGGTVLSEVLQTKPAATQALFTTAYGLGTQVGVLLPFSRKHESEADHLGLIFMAMAGYDPHVAVSFWQRMASASSGSTSELLSTHPSDNRRIADLEKEMDEAMKYYKAQ